MNLDGKLYDAYVTYPQPDTTGFSEEVEKFALHTLPEELEKAFGYKLFIAGRDCLPGQGKAPLDMCKCFELTEALIIITRHLV